MTCAYWSATSACCCPRPAIGEGSRRWVWSSWLLRTFVNGPWIVMGTGYRAHPTSRYAREKKQVSHASSCGIGDKEGELAIAQLWQRHPRCPIHLHRRAACIVGLPGGCLTVLQRIFSYAATWAATTSLRISSAVPAQQQAPLSPLTKRAPEMIVAHPSPIGLKLSSSAPRL